MDPKQEEQLFSFMAEMAASLASIASSLAPKAPNYHYPIADYANFDWATIGATVRAEDRFGAAVVAWGGHTWNRRSPENKFGEAVWFSRADGQAEDGSVRYVRLVTFKDAASPEPISRKVEDTLARGGKPILPPPPPPEILGHMSAGLVRPYPPKMVKEKIRDLAAITYADKEATRDERAKMTRLLGLIFAGQPDAASRAVHVLRYLTGKGADLELPDSQVLAVLHWINPTSTPGGGLTPHPNSLAEADLIYKETAKIKA